MTLWFLAITASAAGPADTAMLGNSYTQLHDLDARLAEALVAMVPTLETPPVTTKLTAGGLRLPDHVSRLDPETGNPAWQSTLAEGAVWGTVVLQDQSQVPGFPHTNPTWQASRDAAVTLDATAAGVGAHTVLLLTWGRRTGDDSNPDRYPDFSTMQGLLTDGVLAYGDAVAAAAPERPPAIAPAGPAFAFVYDADVDQGLDPTHPDSAFSALYEPDGSHPSLAGSTLTAHVLAATLSGWPASGADVPTALPAHTLDDLQRAADAVVFADPFGPWGFVWAVSWEDVEDDADAGALGHPWLRRHVQVLDHQTAGALTLQATVLVVSAGALSADALICDADSGLRVSGGALSVGTSTCSIEVEAGTLSFLGDAPTAGAVVLGRDGRWDLSSAVLTVSGGGHLAGTVSLPDDAAVGDTLARFAVAPELSDLQVEPDHLGLSVVEEAGVWALVVSEGGAGPDTGGAPDDDDPAANPSASSSAERAAGGCGGGGAALAVLPLLLWGRRRRC